MINKLRCFRCNKDITVSNDVFTEYMNSGCTYYCTDCKKELDQEFEADRNALLGKDVRSFNIGNSDYSKHKIQPWDIWDEYKLNPFDADIVKRVLRHKERVPKSFIDKLKRFITGSTLDELLKEDAICSRKEDYEKIIHICQERIRQIDSGENPYNDL